MWARSSSTFVRTQGSRLGATHICGRLKSPGIHVRSKIAATEPPKFAPEMECTSEKFAHNFSSGSRYLSSEAGARNVGQEDDELEDGFSELEISSDSEANEILQMDEDKGFGSEPETQSDVKLYTEHVGARSLAGSDLARAILNNPKSVRSVLDKYVSDGNPLDTSVISHTMLALRKRLMYQQALQLSEWLEAKKAVDFNEVMYASRLDLVAKVHGLQKAEQYIKMVPESFRGELVYRTLLANCVSFDNVKKAEEVYNKMRQLNFATSSFTCNQMIILYKKVDRKKIADILLYMEKENVKPTLVTYKHLIDTKGRSADIIGMEKVAKTMKDDGFKPDVSTTAIMVKHYIAAGYKEEASSLLMEIKGRKLKDIRPMCAMLIPLYASLGNEEEVERVWNICKKNPQHDEYIAAIDAWGKLKQIEKAEAVFNNLAKTKKVASRHYATLLRIYADNKMLKKGQDLMRRMEESGCQIGPLTLDALVKLYLELGEVEKADAILEKARLQLNNLVRPMLSTYMSIMEEYAKRGDVHNSEKMFARLKQVGYSCRLSPFRTLLQAYITSRTTPYGFKERMKAENIFPNRTVMCQLSEVDPFKQTAVSDLLD
ncbi:hypothetical protein V2J09_009310 [Rumex salicifolius]